MMIKSRKSFTDVTVLAAVAVTIAWIEISSGVDKQEPVIRWGGSTNSNMSADVRNLPADPGNMEPLWELKLGTIQYSIPTIDRGRIYIGANDASVDRPGYESTGGGVIMCVDQATGEMIWQLPSPRYFPGIKPPYHFDQWRCGVCSGPVVDGNRIYFVGHRGEVLCLDRDGQSNGNDGPFMEELDYMGITNTAYRLLGSTDGDIIWKYNLIPEIDVVPHDVCGSTLLMVGDLIFACTSNGIDDKHNKIPRPDVPTLIVLDKKTGRLVARDDEKIGQRMFHCNWSSPIAGKVKGRTLIFFGGGDGILYAFELPQSSAEVQVLKKVWSYDCNPSEYRVRDGVPVPYAKYNRHIPGSPNEIIGVPVLYNGRVYVVIGQSPLHGNGRGCLSCVDAATGTKVWSSQLVDRSLANPAIADGLLYIPDTSGNLHCFDTVTGERYWVHSLERKAWCASAFVADDKVYAGTEANTVWVLKAGKEKEVLSRMRLKSMPITLTAGEGVLYVPTQRSLIAVPGGPMAKRITSNTISEQSSSPTNTIR
ncbi:MAG: PQQ-binding-like beta-propeller repeat protein [Kiritimatiellae bacterium]|nr:PQQ-binding-like beta-propeller repeat protein [Kiritimatiellia bacterium]MDD5519405.1 PQQ-binding-like beta-propeller repeat protein [Kiritimatiellia bacterium]